MSTQTIGYFVSIIKSAKELSGKEKAILVKRLQKQKLEKLGRKYKVTGERIRQIEKEALLKFEKRTVQLILFD